MANCCTNCFLDGEIKEFIKSEGIKGICSFCNAKNVFCLPPENLNDFFLPILNQYSIVKTEKNSERIRAMCIWDKLDDDWQVFSSDVQDKKSMICKEIISKQLKEGETDFLSCQYALDYELSEEETLESGWEEFSDELTNINRFFPSKQMSFDDFISLIQYIDLKIEPPKNFYRCRNTPNGVKIKPKEMGPPPREKTKNGRANPVGIPYLYVASDINTAIHESRPFINETVTIGKFKLIDAISIVDLRSISPFKFSGHEDIDELIPKIKYLRRLGLDLSKPISPKDADLDYLPTQYLCEFIKKQGWDGVAYNSGISDGYNLAIFSVEKLKCNRTSFYVIDKTTLHYKKMNT